MYCKQKFKKIKVVLSISLLAQSSDSEAEYGLALLYYNWNTGLVKAWAPQVQ
jgi:hypothetical protein